MEQFNIGITRNTKMYFFIKIFYFPLLLYTVCLQANTITKITIVIYICNLHNIFLVFYINFLYIFY